MSRSRAGRPRGERRGVSLSRTEGATRILIKSPTGLGKKI
jgi:hypothetical protein